MFGFPTIFAGAILYALFTFGVAAGYLPAHLGEIPRPAVIAGCIFAGSMLTHSA